MSIEIKLIIRKTYNIINMLFINYVYINIFDYVCFIVVITLFFMNFRYII